MIQKLIIKYLCPDCKHKFSSMKNVNQHIRKTGCNHFIKVNLNDYFSKPQIQEIVSSSVKYLGIESA